MPGESELIASAGNFSNAVVAFLLMALVPVLVYAIKRILDDNSKFHERSLEQQAKANDMVLEAIKEIIASVREYRDEVRDFHKESMVKLENHDEQAKCIKRLQEKTFTTLENRPCIAKNGTER